MLVRTLYSLIWFLTLPIVLLRLAWRARRQPGYLHHLPERFGRYRMRPDTPTIWLHAVSVGETRAAEPLVRAVLDRWPNHTLVLTQMTPTGRETAQAILGTNPRIVSAYLPYDLSLFSRRFLRHFRPEFGIIMETELWPNLLATCEAQKTPVILANARLSERSARRYARWPALTRITVGALAAIGGQTEDDARRLRELGAKGAQVTGNIKFDIAPPESMNALSASFRSLCGDRPLLLAASTREGEEALLLDAFASQAPADALLLLVPRHPQRFDDVAQLVSARGFKLQRRSAAEAVRKDTRVWLGDSMGEMFAYYDAADVALIGGSWLPFGGQNLIEACAVGTPVIIGPHTYNFTQVAEQAIASGAAQRAADASAGITAAIALLHDKDARKRMGEDGKRFASAHRGATQRTVQLIEQMLGEQAQEQ